MNRCSRIFSNIKKRKKKNVFPQSDIERTLEQIKYLEGLKVQLEKELAQSNERILEMEQQAKALADEILVVERHFADTERTLDALKRVR